MKINILKKLDDKEEESIKGTKNLILTIPKLQVKIQSDNWKQLHNEVMKYLYNNFESKVKNRLIDNGNHVVNKRGGTTEFRYCSFNPAEKGYINPKHYQKINDDFFAYNFYENPQNALFMGTAIKTIIDNLDVVYVESNGKGSFGKLIDKSEGLTSDEDYQSSIVKDEHLFDWTNLKKELQIRISSQALLQRDSKMTMIALKRDNHQCVIDNHLTFVKPNGLNYVEGHHVIPYSKKNAELFWDKGIDLDHPNNIISLCPNCHRMVHHGNEEVIEDILKKIYTEAQDRLLEIGLDITYEQIKSLYLR